jgi:hypothetical protein
MRMDFYQIIVSSQTNTKTFFSGREGGEEKEQGRADSVEVSDQLIVAVAAKLLVKARTQGCALVLDIISWYLICAHSWGKPPLLPTSRKSLLATL